MPFGSDPSAALPVDHHGRQLQRQLPIGVQAVDEMINGQTTTTYWAYDAIVRRKKLKDRHLTIDCGGEIV